MIHSFKQTAHIRDWFILPIYHGDNRHCKEFIPAWSLHRLIEMMPNIIREIVEVDGYAYMGSNKIAVTAKHIRYRFTYTHLDREKEYTWKYFHKDNLYDNAVDCIEWLIKNEYFNKEYLV